MKNIISVFTILCILFTSQCQTGVQLMYSSAAVTTATLTCLKSNGFSFVIIPASTQAGTYDKNVNQVLLNAKAAGISADISIHLCRALDASKQIQDVLKNIDSTLYQKVWLYVWDNFYPGCGWNGDNCGYVKETIQKVKSYSKKPMIYSIYFYWSTIMGSKLACQQIAKQADLWYLQDTKQSSQSFADFSPFGGWTRPTMKTFTFNVQSCGLPLNKVYRQ